MRKDAGSRASLFERLEKGLQECIEFEKGNLDLRTTEIPDAPPDVSADEVVEMRRRLGLSQSVFAKLINVSTKTVQSWEQGVRRPSQSALRLLQLVEADPAALLRVVRDPNRGRVGRRGGTPQRSENGARKNKKS